MIKQEKYEDGVLCLMNIKSEEMNYKSEHTNSGIQVILDALEQHLKLQNRIYDNFEIVQDDFQKPLKSSKEALINDFVKVEEHLENQQIESLENFDIENGIHKAVLKIEADFDDFDDLDYFPDVEFDQDDKEIKPERLENVSKGEVHQNFACEVCDKSFNIPSALKNHMMTHTSERPFPCDVCKKRFKDKRDLKSHMYTHATEKPYEVKFYIL